MRKSLLIAVDFDGTVVEDKYPGVGKAKPFAIETLKMLQNDGHRLILWTYRHGSKLKDAVRFMEDNGVPPYAVNRSYPRKRHTLQMFPERSTRISLLTTETSVDFQGGERFISSSISSLMLPYRKKRVGSAVGVNLHSIRKTFLVTLRAHC